MKIPVKETISSGDWVQFNTTYFDKAADFRLKPISFEKIDLSAVDNPQKIKLDQGVLWLLRIEVVNISKTPFPTFQVLGIRLMDNEDFTFNVVQDGHLIYESNYAKSNGLSRFANWNSVPDLTPKIKTVGALAFLLPDEDQADYFFSIQHGSVQAL